MTLSFRTILLLFMAAAIWADSLPTVVFDASPVGSLQLFLVTCSSVLRDGLRNS
jgi:hypothetical protein